MGDVNKPFVDLGNTPCALMGNNECITNEICRVRSCIGLDYIER